ncbi:Glyoxylase, beta-lactamase superfamily II [Clostridium sp. USBA 49]|uniref:MBL fold metallo-hydrolase n=1 Tax=Clostridium sp. USBA 49 TaxID=1881060 RepID=UPI0009D581F2|nr:MBL fold metallo-hydrolase [Clostridium sp. USBA 49]SKA85332.1 Glyoxylase, beta-lactamase superfamily II [Clostridium sp. USBA 49]
MKLLNSFYQVSGEVLTHRFDATSYLLNCGKFAILIDCGTPEGFDKLIENIKKCGVEPRNIKYIFGTHGHYDHIGAAYLFKEKYGSEVFLHENDVKRVEDGDDIKTTAGLLYGKSFTPFKVDRVLKKNKIFNFESINIEVIHTPGHTPGSVCYVLNVSDLKVLIAGDTLYGGFSTKIDSNEEDWKKSLDCLCERKFDLMVVGHSNPILLGDVEDRLKDARASFAHYYNPWFKTFKDKYKY